MSGREFRIIFNEHFETIRYYFLVFSIHITYRNASWMVIMVIIILFFR